MPSTRIGVSGVGLQGPPGATGSTGPAGVVQAVVAGANVTVDNTDPAHPVVAASGGGGGGVDVATIHAATSKTTPVDADEMLLVDSAASFGLKKLTWANLKAAIKTYLDGTGIAKLATARNINGVAFNGTADITITNNAPLYIWRYASGAYPALPGTKPTGTVLVEALGPVDPAQSGATIPAWIVPGTCDLLYQVTPS